MRNARLQALPALLLAASLAVPGAVPAQEPPEWQLVLLKPQGCGACPLVEDLLKRRGSPREVVLDAGGGDTVTAVVQRRASSDLTDAERAELRELAWYDEPRWRRQAEQRGAQLLLKQRGRVVAGGDIADSADLRDTELPAAITTPSTRDDFDAIRDRRARFYQAFFSRTWNFDWFLRLARNPGLARQRSAEAWVERLTAGIAAPAQATGCTPPRLPAPCSPNVLLMATASAADDNEIFNAIRITGIRERLAEIGVATDQVRVFHGGGNIDGANAVEEVDGRRVFTRRELPGAEPFRPRALAEAFAAFRARRPSRNLLVLVGHGAPEGAGMWGHPAGLSPEDLAALHRYGGGDDVLVSGNCFGGVMALSASCGFFGARPDVVASGCQADAAEVARSADYLHAFFGSLAPGATAADADRDGRVTFEEAHWQATLYGDERNITYTTVDALAEAHFERQPDALPAQLTVAEVLDLAQRATPAEARAARALAGNLPRDMAVPLRDFPLLAQRYTLRPDGPRPALSQLAKRLVFVTGSAADPAVAAARRCGDRDIAAFLRRE